MSTSYKKIAFIANSKWYISNFRLSTLKEFTKQKFRCYVYTPEDADIVFDKEVAHVPIKLNPQSKNILTEIWSLCSVFSKLFATKHDVIFSFNPKTNLYSLIVGCILRIPVVVNVSGVGQASLINGPIGLIYKTLISFFYTKAAHCFFQNTSDMNHYIERGYVLRDNATLLPGSGVNLTKFQPSYQLNKNKLNFLMASRLIKQKGVVEYLESAVNISKNYNCCSFVLAGVADNSERGISKELIDTYVERCAHIDFIGQSNEIHNVMNNVDVVVLPSFYPEGTPKVLLEAAASGKIIITTDTPGCNEVVIDGLNGFLIQPYSNQSLYNAIEKVINLPTEALIEMQKESRKMAELKFDEQFVLDKYLNIAEMFCADRDV